MTTATLRPTRATLVLLIKYVLLMAVEIAMDTCYLVVIYANCYLTTWPTTTTSSSFSLATSNNDVIRGAIVAPINTTNRSLVSSELDHHQPRPGGHLAVVKSSSDTLVVILQDFVLDFNLFLLIAILVRWYLLLTCLRQVLREVVRSGSELMTNQLSPTLKDQEVPSLAFMVSIRVED